MYSKIILASGSPRRRELMTRIGMNFQYVTSEIKEEFIEGKDFAEQAMMLAAKKAYNVSNIYDEAFIIAADTVVTCDDRIFGKPKSEEDVYETLRFLSGKTHEVITGVALINKREQHHKQFYEKTKVHFREFTDDFIKWYIKSEEPFDKAGSYGIQGKGCLMVTGIEGCYDNVVGLPVSRLFEFMMEIGIRPGGMHGY